MLIEAKKAVFLPRIPVPTVEIHYLTDMAALNLFIIYMSFIFKLKWHWFMCVLPRKNCRKINSNHSIEQIVDAKRI